MEEGVTNNQQENRVGSSRKHPGTRGNYPQVASSSIDVALNGALSCDMEKLPSPLFWVLIYVAVLEIKT